VTTATVGGVVSLFGPPPELLPPLELDVELELELELEPPLGPSRLSNIWTEFCVAVHWQARGESSPHETVWSWNFLLPHPFR